MRYLGFADQDIDANGGDPGKLVGTWNDSADDVVEIGMEVVRQGALRGYRGFVGIDMIENEDGRWGWC